MTPRCRFAWAALLGIWLCWLPAHVGAQTPALSDLAAPEAIATKTDGLALPDDRTVPPGAGYTIVTATTTGTIKWLVLPSDPQVQVTLFGKSVIIGAPPGAVIHVYAIASVPSKDGKTTDLTDWVRTVVTVDGQAPAPPGPPQPPTPPVPPQPPAPPVATGPANVLIVEDPLRRTPAIAALIQSPKIRAATKTAGHTFRVFDVRDPELVTANLLPYVQKAGVLPVLLVQDQKTGKVLLIEGLPAQDQSVIDHILKAAGTVAAATDN